MGTKKQSKAKALAEKIEAESKPRKRERKKKLTAEENDRLIPVGEIKPIWQFPPGTEVQLVIDARYRGRILRHTFTGTTLDGYAHTEGNGEFEISVPRRTIVISSETRAQELRRKRKYNKQKKE